MEDRIIDVGKAEFLEWLTGWGEIQEGDEILQVRIGYGQDIQVTVGNPNKED